MKSRKFQTFFRKILGNLKPFSIVNRFAEKGRNTNFYLILAKDVVFRRVGSLEQNFTHYIIFSNDELHIILKRGNLEICENSSSFNY